MAGRRAKSTPSSPCDFLQNESPKTPSSPVTPMSAGGSHKEYSDWNRICTIIISAGGVEATNEKIDEMTHNFLSSPIPPRSTFPWKVLVQQILDKFGRNIEELKEIFSKALIKVEYKIFTIGGIRPEVIRYNNELIESLCGYHVHEVLSLPEFKSAIMNEKGTTKGYTFLNCVCWPRSHRYPIVGFERKNEDIIETLRLLLKIGCSPEKRNESNGGETSIGSLLEAQRKNVLDKKIGLMLYREMTLATNFSPETFTKIMISICNKMSSDEADSTVEASSIVDWLCWAFTQKPDFVSKIIFESIYKTASNIINNGTSKSVFIGINRVVNIFKNGPQLEKIVCSENSARVIKNADFSIYFEHVKWVPERMIERFRQSIVRNANAVILESDSKWNYIIGAFIGECGTMEQITEYITHKCSELYHDIEKKIISMNCITCFGHAKRMCINREVIVFLNEKIKEMDGFCQSQLCSAFEVKFGLDPNTIQNNDILNYFDKITATN